MEMVERDFIQLDENSLDHELQLYEQQCNWQKRFLRFFRLGFYSFSWIVLERTRNKTVKMMMCQSERGDTEFIGMLLTVCHQLRLFLLEVHPFSLWLTMVEEDIEENIYIVKLELDILSTPTGREIRSAFVSSIDQRQRQAPKMQRRMSAYKYFMRECLDELRDRYPKGSIVLPAVSRLCAQVWSGLDPRIKQRFKDAMEASQPDYVPITTIKDEPEALLNFTSEEYHPATPPLPPKASIREAKVKKSTVPAEEKKERKKRKKTGKKTIPGGPKRPLSAFVYFCKYNRSLVKKEKPHLTICDISKVLGHTWNGMSEKQKWQYVQISIQDRDRYSREMAAFKSAAAAAVVTIKEEKVDHGYPVPERDMGHPYEFQFSAANYYRVKEEPVDMLFE